MPTARIIPVLAVLVQAACASSRPPDPVAAAIARCASPKPDKPDKPFDPKIEAGRPELPEGLACIPWPVHYRKITSTFRDPKHRFTPGQHNGTDIFSPLGTDVLAPLEGEVEWTREVEPCQDAAVSVRFADGWTYQTHHLSRVDVRKGERVVKGRRLGLTGGAVGADGSGPWTTGPHLHFALLHGDRYVDAALYLCP